MNTTARPRVPCECADPGCPAHVGVSRCRELTYERGHVLFRSDMDDRTGTVFCAECLTDALDSGLFTSEKGDT